MKNVGKISVLIAVILGIVALSGCEQASTTISTYPGSVLPIVNNWTMNKINIENPEGVSMEKGAYNNGDKAVILSVVHTGSDNVIKNTLIAFAYEAIELPAKSVCLIGKNSAVYMTDNYRNIHLIYFVDESKKGYIAVADKKEDLVDFFTIFFGNVLFE